VLLPAVITLSKYDRIFLDAVSAVLLLVAVALLAFIRLRLTVR
jgi:hypothetical protein